MCKGVGTFTASPRARLWIAVLTNMDVDGTRIPLRAFYKTMLLVAFSSIQ